MFPMSPRTSEMKGSHTLPSLQFAARFVDRGQHQRSPPLQAAQCDQVQCLCTYIHAGHQPHCYVNLPRTACVAWLHCRKNSVVSTGRSVASFAYPGIFSQQNWAYKEGCSRTQGMPSLGDGAGNIGAWEKPTTGSKK